MSRFVAAMLWRELRASWKRLLLFLLSISAGVGGMVTVKSFGYGLEETIRLEARTLMASDLRMSSQRPFSAEERAALKELEAGGARSTLSIHFVAMALAPSNGQVRLVEVRAVGAEYPFYGKVRTTSGRPFRELLNDDTVLVHPTVLSHFKLGPGDPLRIGQRTLRIAGSIETEPDRPVQILSFGPRVLMTLEAAQTTGLTGPLSRIHYNALIKLPPGDDPVATAKGLRARLPERLSVIRTYDESQPRVQRFLGRLTDYLNLLGLAALILGGIGVAGAIRVFMGQKLDTLAILKCLGATSSQLFAVYLSMAVLLGAVGSLAGAALGLSLQGVLAGLLSDFLPVSFGFAFSWRALAQGVGLGMLTTLWFAFPPLLLARRVPPARVFRRQVESAPERSGRWRQLAFTVLSALVLVGALTLLEVGFGRLATIALGGLVGTFVALHLAAWSLLALLQRLPKPASFALKQGLSGLYRPGNQSASVVVSLGLGVLLMLAVFLIQGDLLRQVASNSPNDQPNLFFIDIQEGQRQTFRDTVVGSGHRDPELIPIVRARLRALNDKPLRLDDIADPDIKRILSFEYAMTYRGELVEGEEIVAGAFRPGASPGGPEVSVAEWWSERVGMGVGDSVTLDVQGIPVRAVINSVRRIDWGSRRANFSFVFMPGVLEKAPKVFVAGLSVREPEARVALQQKVVARLPNVSVIDAESIFSLVQGIMDRIAVVIQFMAAFSIAVGVVILIGAIATTKFQRIREAVLLKTLGATRWVVAKVLATEYLVLGGLAGLVGVLAAGGFSWGLVTFVFEGRWDFSLPPYLAAWALTTVLILATGLINSLDVLMKKPLDVLREE